MKSNAPWSVKGIERDARETAKEAARREGMTVGEWLNQMIYSQAEGGAPGARSDTEVEGLKLRDIVTAIEHLRNRVVEAESKHAAAVSELTRNMGGFVERVQRLERVKPAEGSHQDIAQRIEKLERAGGDRHRGNGGQCGSGSSLAQRLVNLLHMSGLEMRQLMRHHPKK